MLHDVAWMLHDLGLALPRRNLDLTGHDEEVTGHLDLFSSVFSTMLKSEEKSRKVKKNEEQLGK